jgi:hypothetical protein
MQPIDSYENVRTAVRDLGEEGFVAAVLGAVRARRLNRWKDLVQELREGTVQACDRPDARRGSRPSTGSGPSWSLA